ncbi:MAG: DUF2156 domain-containing protein [Chloroflexi bacterium]|nr:DUF2156 domain-containing protein [Chloroflexota bacterium]
MTNALQKAVRTRPTQRPYSQSISGYRADIVPPPLTHTLLHEVSDEWLVMMPGKEMRFSLGWFDNDYIGSSAVIVVRDETGRVTAFANLVPEYARREVSIDLMRRRQEVENGRMGLQMARSVNERYARQQNVSGETRRV